MRTASFEAWLIEWGAAGTLELHDHGGALGVLRVVRGELVETYTDLAEQRPLHRRTLSADYLVRLPPTRAHEVWNANPEPALSVHVYSPPLTTMTFFDHRADHFLEPLRADVAVP